MTPTVKLADYVFGCKLSLEKPDYTRHLEWYLNEPFAHYTPALLEAEGDVIDEWEFFWGMAHRMRIPVVLGHSAFGPPEPGLPKNRLVAEIYKVAIEGTEGHFGDYPAIVPMLPSGMDATAPHLTWDDRPFEAGEGTFFEIAGCYRRYHCPLSRTVFLGAMPKKYADAERAVLKATEAGLAKALPGNRAEEVALAFFDELERHGFSKDSRTGYSIGLSYPPDWGERTVSLRRGDKTVLEQNMTLHFMPALWLDDGGLELSETILITDKGAECLANVPRRVVVKG